MEDVMSDIARLKQEVSATITRIRKLELEGGVNHKNLNEIKKELLMLAANKDLFSEDTFPINPTKDGYSAIYRLSEDEDHRFALYASTALAGKGVHPHNHTTWAVIVGVLGDEHNVFYKRKDDNSEEGKGTLEVVKRFTVKPGSGVTLMPEDIHSIHTSGNGQTIHLHMYGLALEQLHHRVMYNMEMGTFSQFPASQNIKAIY